MSCMLMSLCGLRKTTGQVIFPENKVVDVIIQNLDWAVNALKVRYNYVLRIWFEDGSVKNFDYREIFYDKPFQQLKDISFFAKAHVFADTVVWNDKIDIAPEYLHEHGKIVTENS